MYYLVNGYRFINPEKWMQLTVFTKTSEKQIFTVASQNYASFRRLYKNLSANFFFSQMFLQHFSNRPSYPNVKIILAYFYIIKTI